MAGHKKMSVIEDKNSIVHMRSQCVKNNIRLKPYNWLQLRVCWAVNQNKRYILSLFKKKKRNKISVDFQNIQLENGIVPVIKVIGKMLPGSLGTKMLKVFLMPYQTYTSFQSWIMGS